MAHDIKWSPRPWSLHDFTPDLQARLQQLQPHQPLLTERVNGDALYVRRIADDRFQSGLHFNQSVLPGKAA